MQLAQLRQQVVAVVGGAAGIKGVLPYAPDAVDSGPVAWLGDAVAEVTMGQAELWSWTLPLTVAVPRNARYGDEQVVLEGVIAAVMDRVRANYVPADTMGLSVVRLTQGTAGPDGAKFAAVTFWFRVKQRFAATLT